MPRPKSLWLKVLVFIRRDTSLGTVVPFSRNVCSFEFAINCYKVPKDERDPWAVHLWPARRLLYTSMLLPEKLSLFLPSQTITGNSTSPVEGTILTARANLRRPSLQMVLLCLTFAKYEVIRAYPRLGVSGLPWFSPQVPPTRPASHPCYLPYKTCTRRTSIFRPTKLTDPIYLLQLPW